MKLEKKKLHVEANTSFGWAVSRTFLFCKTPLLINSSNGFRIGYYDCCTIFAKPLFLKIISGHGSVRLHVWSITVTNADNQIFNIPSRAFLGISRIFVFMFLGFYFNNNSSLQNKKIVPPRRQQVHWRFHREPLCVTRVQIARWPQAITS